MGIKSRIKKELGYMKIGAKVAGKMAVQKTKTWMKEQMEEAKERAAAEKDIQKAARAAELEAYKAESIAAAKARGAARAKKGGRSGWKGALQELGEAGKRISLGEQLGIPQGRQEKVVSKSEISGLGSINTSSYMFSGLGQKKKKKKNG